MTETVNKKLEPFLVRFEKFSKEVTQEYRFEECIKQLAELELRVSRLEEQAEKFNQERKQ